MGKTASRALIGLLFLSIAASAVHAQQEPATDSDTDVGTTTSVLDPSTTDAIIELLTTSYTADLALETAVRTAECARTEPNCAPLFLAQEVILGPWNFMKLLRVMQELPDPDFRTIFRPRDHRTPSLPPTGVLPAETVSLVEYALEQQVALYEPLEAWQVTLERLNAAVAGNDEYAAAAQRRALRDYSTQMSTAAAGLNAVSSQLLERLAPLIGPFASAVAVEDVEAAQADLRDNGFVPGRQQRFSALGVSRSDIDTFLGELGAVSADTPMDLLGGLAAVANGYDDLADLMTVPPESGTNLRPVADAGPDRAASSGDADRASVVLDGTRSRDPDADALEYLWTGTSIKVSGSKPAITLPLGTHHIFLTVTDGKGGADVDLVTITVADANAPRITAVTATPAVLSPPTRQLVSVEIDVEVVDNDDPAPFCQVVSVSVNEPADAAGSATEPDIVLDGSLTLLLRAERSGEGAGRAYGLTIQCTDKSNHSSFGSVSVSVPR